MIKYKKKIAALMLLATCLSGCSYDLKDLQNLNKKSSSVDTKGITILCEHKKYTEAMKIVDDYLKKHPDDRVALCDKGYVLVAQGKNEEGLLQLVKANEKYPNDDAILNNMSWAYNNLKMYKLANSYADQSLKKEPNTAEELSNKGTALFGLKDYKKAESYYTKAIEKKSTDKTAIWGKALSLYKEKSYNKSLTYFKKYYKLDSSDMEASYYIEKCYISLHDVDGAISTFKDNIIVNPKNKGNYFALGDMYVKKEDYSSAISCYDNLAEIDSEDPEIYFEKAICLIKSGDKDGACENLKIALNYDSDYIDDIKEEPAFDVLKDYDKFKEIFNAN
ncbi:tetratricopeptide repeat protein [Clostridium felsineum]|uniref:tetratricopeptide repeat protein n=1 Tax=Clostridium felsineum TaxID=36839 RepID=UPI00098BF0C1|nr:tetratricopeptide repeat protein [Clostridium felsineum]URZ03839.1 Beta-barrel assembly-enhancing protease [Clostridium felsineum]